MLRVNTRPRKRNSPRIAEKSAPAFLQWLRGRACLLAERTGCAGKIEAAHVDYAGDKGTGTKVSDRYAVPLCSDHHREQHQFGWSDFEARHSVDALYASKCYWHEWPKRWEWERRLADNG